MGGGLNFGCSVVARSASQASYDTLMLVRTATFDGRPATLG